MGLCVCKDKNNDNNDQYGISNNHSLSYQGSNNKQKLSELVDELGKFATYSILFRTHISLMMYLLWTFFCSTNNDNTMTNNFKVKNKIMLSY
jgi:hypothetical protein